MTKANSAPRILTAKIVRKIEMREKKLVARQVTLTKNPQSARVDQEMKKRKRQ
jgi:hypothetical protein